MNVGYDISVIIPLYNVQDYIEETLNSVVQQNIVCNIECLLIDDCGNDSSVSVAEKFIENYKGNVDFRIICHKENKGLSVARNTGILNANGQYLFFLDGDDKLFPDSLQSLWDVIRNHPHVDIVKGDFCIEGLSDSILRKDFPPYSEDAKWIRTHFCNLSIPESACNCLMKRQLIVENKLFFKEGWIQEDTLWTFKIQRYIKSIAFCFKPTYFYRTNQSSIMHTMDKEKAAKAYSLIFNEAYNDMLLSKIERYELRYLEIMAERIYNAVGEKGLKSLCTNCNFIFNMLFRCDRELSHGNNRFVDAVLRGSRSLLRSLLCNKIIFSYR